jgi:hypothetical protein
MDNAIHRVNLWIQANDPTLILNLSHYNLTELPKIPSNCQILWCNNNALTVLLELPNCKVLHCFYNKLTALPDLPNCVELACCYNELTALPPLPNCRKLECERNKLTAIPELSDQCYRLYCRYNQLTALPKLSSKLTHLFMFTGNKYLWITKKHSKKYGIQETSNYSKCAKIIQRNYRRYIIRKCKLLDKYLLKGPIKIVNLYI